MIYTVQAGDTLDSIALRLLRTKQASQTLWQINQSRIRSGTQALAPGEKLIIPEQMIQAAKATVQSKRDPNDVALEVNGLQYAGWESVRVSRAIDQGSGSFNLAVQNKWELLGEAWPIFEGDEVLVWIGSDLVLTGYVDTVDVSADANSRTMTIEGRDRTCDLIDCSAMNKPRQFRNKTLLSLARLLAKPFGISVITDVPVGPAIPTFALLPGEKVHEAIERAARTESLMISSTASSELLITVSGNKRADDKIVEGVNFLHGSARASGADRYSLYVVEGQGSGQDKKKRNFKGEFQDPGVSRYRPLLIMAESKADGTYVDGRAEGEARNRAAKSRTANVTVQGWRQKSGRLWETNRIVEAQIDMLGLSEDHLITEVVFELSESGTITNLTLARPDAYAAKQELKAAKDIMKVRRKQKKGKKSHEVTQADVNKALSQ